MKKRTLWLLGLALLGVCSPAFAAGNFDLSTIMGQYQQAATTFGTVIQAASLKLVYLLFTIELAWTLSWRLLKGSDIVDIGITTVSRVGWLGVVLLGIEHSDFLLDIVNGFIQLAKQGAGVSGSSPSDVFWMGIDVINKMDNQFAPSSGILAPIANFFPNLLLFGADIIVLLCFGYLAATFAVTYIQLWFFMAVYPIVLAWGVTRWTRDMAMRIFTTPLVYGVRFLALYFVIAIAMQFGTWVGSDINNLSFSNFEPLWAVMGSCIVLALLAMKAPQMAAELLSGTASMTAGDGVAAGLAAGGAIGAMGAGALGMAKMAGGAANSVAGAAQAGQSAVAQAKEKGATGMAGIAGGAAMALGSGVAEAARDGIKGLGSNSAGGSLANRIDNKTAGIREANAASSVSAATVPGAQPAAPAATATGAAAPASSSTAASGGAATRATPAAPAATPSAGTATPSAPASSTLDLSGDIGAALAARNAGSAPSAPAAPAPGRFAPPASPASSSTGSASTPAPASTPAAQPAGASTSAPAPASSAASTSAPASAPATASRQAPPAPSGGSIGGPNSAPSPDTPTPQQSPSATSQMLSAATRALEQAQRAEGSAAGASIQTHHGDDV